MTLAELRDELDTMASFLPPNTKCGILFRGEVRTIDCPIPVRLTPDTLNSIGADTVYFTGIIP